MTDLDRSGVEKMFTIVGESGTQDLYLKFSGQPFMTEILFSEGHELLELSTLKARQSI